MRRHVALGDGIKCMSCGSEGGEEREGPMHKEVVVRIKESADTTTKLRLWSHSETWNRGKGEECEELDSRVLTFHIDKNNNKNNTNK